MRPSTAAARLNSAGRERAASSAVAVIVLLLALVTRPAGAQGGAARDSARAAADSLAERLRRAEEAIAALQQQVADQASGGATTRSRMSLVFGGRVLMHAFRNERRVNNVDDPQFVRPDSATALPASALGLAIRQTTLTAAVRGDALGGRFLGDVDVDFYGGQQPSSGGRTFPLLRLRTARGIVRWDGAELLVGQESPLIAGVNPVSLAAIGTPAFVTAGNLWLWLPQVRGTVERAGDVRIALQGAVLASTTGDAVAPFDTDADAAERSGRPALETRVRLRWGEEETAGEAGCGAHLGWIAVSGDTLVSSRAAACDVQLPLGSRAELRGEAYAGRALRGLGGGGVSQNLGVGGVPLRDRGGWVQLNVKLSPLLSAGAGCGVDSPEESELPATARLRNQACAAYLTARPAGPLVFGLELRRLDTTYGAGVVRNHHLNVALGFEI